MEFIDRFIQQLRVEEGKSQNTIEAYSRELVRFKGWLEDKEWAKVEADDIRRFLSELSDLGLGARSVFHNLAVLRSFYSFLLEEEIIEKDPSALVEFPKLEKHLPDALGREDVEKLIAAAGGDKVGDIRDQAIVELLYASGLRVSELVTMTLNQLDFDRGILVAHGKGNKNRAVPFGEKADDMLKKYFAQSRPLLDKSGKSPYLFLNRQGARLTRQAVFKMIKKNALKAGIRCDISPHTLRHSFATHMLENGMNLRMVQTLLGHTDIVATEIYTHLDRQRLRAEYDDKHPRSDGYAMKKPGLKAKGAAKNQEVE
jgi:integrase/recombinase XerD